MAFQGRNQNQHRGPGGPNRFVKKDEFDEKVVDLRRVTRVVAGGKRFRFRATVVIGDHKGRVGVGVAKGLDVQSTVLKAKSDAKKELLHLSLVDQRTIPHEVKAKYSAAQVIIKPSKEGQGLKAGGAVRVVLAMAGVKDASAKCLGRTPNKLTNALAAMAALRQLKPAKQKASAPQAPAAKAEPTETVAK
jgi:small subunit ribosomal protein S5